MTVALAWAALRRHPFSLLFTALLVALSASVLGSPIPLALLLWAALSLSAISVWRALEPLILRRLGCRPPGPLECERLNRALGLASGEPRPLRELTQTLAVRLDDHQVMLLDTPEPWLGRGLRSLIVSSALLDLLEDRAIRGLLTQAGCQARSASPAVEVVVYLGNLPLLGAWLLDRGLGQLGRLLAMVVGGSLVVPLLMWPAGFIRWAGRLFAVVGGALCGSALLSSGLAAPGLGLLLAWALVPGLRALLAWEFRRAERLADLATVEADLGWHLLEALEILAFAESVPAPDGLFGLFCRRGSPFVTRAERVWRAICRT